MPMAAIDSEQAIRDCALEIIGLIKRHGQNSPQLYEGLKTSLKPVLARPDLQSLGVYRQGNHIDNSRYLYYDGQLVITLDEFPKDKQIPPHDHGVWEVLAIYRGAVEHKVYERKDDGSTPGYADLQKVEDRVLNAGDISVVSLPAEIHGFKALTDGTFSLTVVGGHYKAERHYFKPEEKTCVVRRPRALS
jgi:predicted metal-dependent enzyme (double-stranded beta helix superfamily)